MTNPQLTIYTARCTLCNTTISAKDETSCRQALANHLEHDCQAVRTMRGWEQAGIYSEMMTLLRQDELITLLRTKVLKHYSAAEVRGALDLIEFQNSPKD